MFLRKYMNEYMKIVSLRSRPDVKLFRRMQEEAWLFSEINTVMIKKQQHIIHYSL